MFVQVFPSVDRIRDCSQHIAMSVIRCAAEEGLATAEALDEMLDDTEDYVKLSMFEPNYSPIVPGRHSLSIPSSMDMV